VIRVATPDDAAQALSIYAPIVRDTFISFEVEVPSVAEMGERIARTLATHPWLVFEDAAGVAGYVHAGAHKARPGYRWSVDVTVYIAERARRRGAGQALYQALFDILRRQGFHMAYAGIALPNAGSVGLHEAVGFRPIGIYPKVGYKLGDWRDVGWWSLELQPMADPPAEPVAFAAL
jgi:phosphinothricin acetyltransferase